MQFKTLNSLFNFKKADTIYHSDKRIDLLFVWLEFIRTVRSGVDGYGYLWLSLFYYNLFFSL